ncbi:MAG: HIT family protein [Candidatus Altiarchaeota archaeon]|nr:HIT family protein [Candidatus Altiarchaeota archaeon]
MGDCILCKLVRGEIGSWRVYEDDFCVGVLDIQPCAPGHCLLVPKKHVERFYEMDDGDLGRLFTAAKKVAKKIKKTYKPDYVCMFIRGGRIHHLHIALFPSKEGDGISGFPQSNYPKTEVDLNKEAEKLRNA